MNKIKGIYKKSPALLTDLYQLTMAYGYWKLGRQDEQAVFNLFFRKNPFSGGFTICCGLAHVVDFLENLKFDNDDLSYLAALTGNDDKPLFENAFLEYLRKMKFELDVDAVPEGTVVFPHQPLLRVKGPIIQCQIIETPLLNMINFQTLIATKAARICQATNGEPVLEFGLRRAQGIDGSITAARAAYIGGCAATSNVLAGKLYGIPVKGTHAHSWVMSFDDELEAFDAYAQAMPNNCVFLVDTFNTIEGVKNAVQAGKKLREKGFEMVGVRLDSGDLAYLSIEARKILDEAGFQKAVIIASNDLDEYIIEDLKKQGATIALWGVGTKLVTAYDQPALGGVYKLSAIKKPGGDWQYKVKLSEQTIKTNTPGILNVRRFRNESGFVADMIYDERMKVPDDPVIVDQLESTKRKKIDNSLRHEDLLVPVFRRGGKVYSTPPLKQTRQRTADQLDLLHHGIRRFMNPHTYPSGIEQNLHDLRDKLIMEARGF